MRKFHYYEYTENGTDGLNVITSDEILDDYWNYWSERMRRKYRDDPEREALITVENCIEDWCIVHWAWEVLD